MNPDTDVFFEDFAPGQITTYGDRLVSRDEIVGFAQQFDPQPFHIDEEAARSTFAGQLIGSGWHMVALMQQMNCAAFLNSSACIGSPGVDHVNWLAPLRPGARLSIRRQVLESTPSRSRGDRGVVRLVFDLYDQATHLCQQDALIMFLRRAPVIAGAGQLRAASATKQLPDAQIAASPDQQHNFLLFFDELELGRTQLIGQYLFTDAEVAQFARQFDDQWFHIDPVLAAAGPFGGIIASGWHTASAWMATMVKFCAAQAVRAKDAGAVPAKLGVSPGFRALRWLLPVRPGDTITYFVKPIEKRRSASRPNWGLVTFESWGVNQRGETVFTFVNAVFWERRRPSTASRSD